MKKEIALPRIIRRQELLSLLGISNATLYRWLNEGDFPRPKKLGANSVGRLESDVREWLENLETA